MKHQTLFSSNYKSKKKKKKIKVSTAANLLGSLRVIIKYKIIRKNTIKDWQRPILKAALIYSGLNSEIVLYSEIKNLLSKESLIRWENITYSNCLH